jgi:nicotinate-nucleotide--dimethylbenzimidazole phosphoribosyltransferase
LALRAALRDFTKKGRPIKGPVPMTAQTPRLTDAQIRHAIDSKTKPLGALGRIEGLAAQIAAFRNTLTPRVDTCVLTIFAADHGIAHEGVSAFPRP